MTDSDSTSKSYIETLEEEEGDELKNSMSDTDISHTLVKSQKSTKHTPAIDGATLPKNCIKRCLHTHMSPQYHFDGDVEKDLYRGLHHFLDQLGRDLEQASEGTGNTTVSPKTLQEYLLGKEFPVEMINKALQESKSFDTTQKHRKSIKKQGQKKHTPEELQRLKAAQKKLFEESRNPFASLGK